MSIDSTSSELLDDSGPPRQVNSEVSSPEEVHDAGGESTAAPDPAHYDLIAKAASAGIMSHRQVESAVVEISGAPGSLAVHLRCTLIPNEDPTHAIDHISQELLADVEKILGEAFVSHDLNFTVAHCG
ncbi:hypothetical protein D3250_01220 [Nesterenkonia natronophila]|uniref:Asp23/Gls24 family envelope stress response protein n=1 Tax=Nesterenkonia natronophila TaxID=2174932 RepID=A0A3A4F3R2_9MICC|nr:hypothetical protein D3250_01220 [Nesterenkonia natronophila]